MTKKDKMLSWSIGIEQTIVAKIPKKWKEYLLNNIGTVYVLNGESFEKQHKMEWQVKSKKAISPDNKIEVSFQDFEKLGGIIEWK